MNAAIKRDILITFLGSADDNKVNTLYTLYEEYMNDSVDPVFTKQQLAILDGRRSSLLSGKDKGIDWQTMHDNVRNRR